MREVLETQIHYFLKRILLLWAGIGMGDLSTIKPDRKAYKDKLAESLP